MFVFIHSVYHGGSRAAATALARVRSVVSNQIPRAWFLRRGKSAERRRRGAAAAAEAGSERNASRARKPGSETFDVRKKDRAPQDNNGSDSHGYQMRGLWPGPSSSSCRAVVELLPRGSTGAPPAPRPPHPDSPRPSTGGAPRATPPAPGRRDTTRDPAPRGARPRTTAPPRPRIRGGPRRTRSPRRRRPPPGAPRPPGPTRRPLRRPAADPPPRR